MAAKIQRINDPEYWRARAEEMRTIAEQMRHHDTKDIMLGIAEDYEPRIADMTEQRQQPHGK